jgi:hypothetical protein
MTGPYDEIINLPHHVSTAHPRMSSTNRAAQFSPFAALTGYESAIKETARLTTERIELGEGDITVLDMKLRILEDSVADRPEIAVTYYKPDERKKGGAYITVSGALKKIDDIDRTIVFVNGEIISIPDVLDIECELFIDLI